MQRDMKLGMALGLTLLGIVGALFFRHEPAAQEGVPPPLADAAELDDRIAEKGKTPYLSGLDEFPEAPAPAPPAATAKSESNPGAASKTKPEAYEPPSFLTKEDAAEHRVFLSSDRAAAPDPIVPPGGAPPTRMHVTAFEEEIPAHNRDWQAGDAKSGSANGTSHSAAKPTAGRTHVIQPGDTLSSIAAKYLGSSARYREIYEANRQVLRSPDDLPDGVTITIPEKAAPAAPNAPVAGHGAPGEGAVPKTRHTSARSSNALPPETLPPSANASETPAPSGGLRFAPVRRNPFSAGRTAGGARPATERSVPQPAAPERNERELPPARREVKSREMPASPPAKASPSKARLELDDSDPFDAPQ